MFPLTNAVGTTVGFSGRVLNPDEKEAKYINTPETTLYHKSELLFGYSYVRQLIRNEETVYVVEGEFDAMSSYQAGIKNVVAIKGSALTEQHATILARTAKRIILALDADSAGIEATKRAIQVVKDKDVFLRVLVVEGGKDPDAIVKEDPAKWREMVQQTTPAYQFLLEQSVKNLDVNDPEQKMQAVRQIVTILSEITHAVELEHYTDVAAEMLHVSRTALDQEILAFQKKATFHVKTEKEPVQELKKQSPQDQRLLYLLSLLLTSETAENVCEKAQMLESIEPYIDQKYQLILKHIKKWCSAVQEKSTYTPADIVRALPEELHQTLSDALLFPQSDTAISAKEWEKTLYSITKEFVQQRMKDLGAEIGELEKIDAPTSQQQQRMSELNEQSASLLDQLRSLPSNV